MYFQHYVRVINTHFRPSSRRDMVSFLIGAVKSLGDATELVRSIFLRRDVPSYLAQNPLLQEQRIEDEVTGMSLNSGQQKAVKYALTSPLTLIQGPPGKYWLFFFVLQGASIAVVILYQYIRKFVFS